MPDEPKPAAKPERDVVLLRGPTEDGKGLRVLRAKADTLSVGEVRPLEDGKPLVDGELVRLRPHEDTPAVCDVEVVHKVSTRSGPPQVATAAYRERWAEIFDRSSTCGDERPN